MKIKNGIENKPVLTGAGETGEFRIRNSAKAFGILSSGLYANKIRAIIREYSCNAVDSHIEAGKADVPFDVHLPTSLEPWFSVRDYGVGLDDVQVRDIFTTYFESTKSGTDDLIGGLGLGSKSAFSYTENFTITAIKDGVKRVFTAFISGDGVPSIALMGQEESTEPTGVEIRFAVEDAYDFRKFYDEARYVYRHFKLRPIVSGQGFTFEDIEYAERDIIPGVHIRQVDAYYGRSSVAIMGNIEYPIELPAHQTEYSDLLKCGLVIEFGIGELDIQASREGLSYIPETVAAINAKLEKLNDSLASLLKRDVDAVKNFWEKAYFLNKKANTRLWQKAVEELVNSNPSLPLEFSRYGNVNKTFEFEQGQIAKRYNIDITVITHHGYSSTVGNAKLTRWNHKRSAYDYKEVIPLSDNVQFVIKDVKPGITNRVRQHWKNNDMRGNIYVLSPADKTKPMKLEQFFKAIKNPPKDQRFNASELDVIERKKVAASAMVLKLEKRDAHGYYQRSNDFVWREAGKVETFDNSKTYYYFPLSGFSYKGEGKFFDSTELVRQLKNSGIQGVDTVYGVRKNELEQIKEHSNWVNLDEYLKSELAKVKTNSLGLVKERIGFDSYYDVAYVTNDLDDSSPFKQLWLELVNVKTDSNAKVSALSYLASMYGVEIDKVDIDKLVQEYQDKLKIVRQRYPMYEVAKKSYNINYVMLAEYITAIDMLKATQEKEETEENIEE